MESILADSNEAMRCEYISAILHASLYIVKRITDKELTLALQLEIVGEESTGQVDYAIKVLEELLCIMEGKLHQVVMGFAQNLIQCESTLQVNRKNRKCKSALKDGSEEEKDLYKNVKWVIEVVVGLLKDRLECMDEELDRKKARIEEYHSKK
ncbi:hypothetical protein C1646_677095 [Rhizophagus diaphanus]|nr:hypothetical protein C1646_677095 [Rhizophagus diaphanus] [Rhizophagus sp. MUCL 43196]